MAEIHAIRTGPSEPEAYQSVEAEQQIIGGLLADNKKIDMVPGLKPEHFCDPAHAVLFAAISAKISAGIAATPVTIMHEVADDPYVKQLDPARYLARLVGASMAAFALPDYAKIVVECWQVREIERAMSEARDGMRARVFEPKPKDHVSDLMSRVYDITGRSAGDGVSSSFLSATTSGVEEINQAYQRGDGLSGISTGVKALDAMTGGLSRSRLYIVGGRPAMGKTTLAMQVAMNCALRGDGVFFASLEMAKQELATRFFAMQSALRRRPVSYFDIARGDIPEDAFRSIVADAQKFEALPFEIGVSATKDPGVLRQAVIRAKSRFPVKLIVIDYLQLMTPPNARNGYERVSETSLFCKSLAMEFDVPVLVTSQLSRAVESRDDKRPVMSDLRESGQIEQDADCIAFTYRHSYYLDQEAKNESDPIKATNLLQESADKRNVMEVLIEKNRGGPTGAAHLFCDMATATVRDR